MQKTFLKNLILVVVLNLLVKPFYIFGIDAQVQNELGADVYGQYFALLNFSFLLNILLDFGIVNFNTRHVAQHPHLVKHYIGKFLGLRLLLFMVYAILTMFNGLWVGYQTEALQLLAILVLNQFLVASIQFARSNMAGLHWFKWDAFISVLDRILMIALMGLILWSSILPVKLSVFTLAWVQTLAYGVSALMAYVILFSKHKGAVKLKYHKPFSRVMLKQSFPYALLILFMMFYNRMDSVMLERLLPNGSEQAGIYAQGFRYLDAINMFALLFAGLLLPIYSRLIKQQQSVHEVLQLALNILFPSGIAIAMVAWFNQEAIMGFLYQEHLIESAQVFGVLMLSFIPMTLVHVYSTLLTAGGNLKWLNRVAALGVILNLSLNAILIPKQGAMGAAIATFITQFLTAISQIILVYVHFDLIVDYKNVIKLVAYACLIVLLTYTLSNSTLQAWWQIIIVAFSSISLLFFLKIIHLKSIFNHLNR